ncbi:hypothetical protein [Marinobacter shengliensis]|uniref:hypothetical protein n=1 Tax=Marinobacter shengliensis TaxID=1389223 RepID=UPI001108D22D|nr:hypothetical protein [Marinobacter shengliensis]
MANHNGNPAIPLFEDNKHYLGKISFMNDAVEKLREIQQVLEIDPRQMHQMLPQSEWGDDGSLTAIHASMVGQAELLIAAFETMEALMPSKKWMKDWFHSPNVPMGDMIGVEMPIPAELAKSRAGLEGMVRYLRSKL